MKIEIDVKQEVISIENYIRVENIKMLQGKDLPRKYLDYPNEWVRKIKGSVWHYYNDRIGHREILCEGESYSEEYFNEKLEIIKRCAKNLHKINLTLAKGLEPSWNNVEKTITI